MGSDECVDGLSQFRDVTEAGPAQGFSGHDAKPDFDLAEPTRRGGGEVEVHVGMLR